MSKKNKITEQEVKKIADLSRLSLTKDELEKRTEDMNNILNCAHEFKIKLPISTLIKKMFKSLVDQGHYNDDHSALYKEIKNYLIRLRRLTFFKTASMQLDLVNKTALLT